MKAQPLLKEQHEITGQSPANRHGNSQPGLTFSAAKVSTTESNDSGNPRTLDDEITGLRARLNRLSRGVEKLHDGIEETHSGLTEMRAWLNELRKVVRAKGENHEHDCAGNGCPDAADRVTSYQAGVTLGVLFAGFHLLWLGLVWSGWAQPALNFVFWAHMIQPVYVVKPFDPFAALILIGFTFSTGFALGSIGAVLWNNLHRTYEQTRH